MTPEEPGGPPGHLGGSQQLPDIQKVLQTLRDIRVGLPTTPGHSGGSPDQSRTSRWVSRLLTDIWESQPSTTEHSVGAPGHPVGSPDHSRTFGMVSR